MTADERELAFYRAAEDLFAAARGVPHTLSPKDFQLLRQWWRDEVPLEAVAAGVAEIVARRRESGSSDPVTSLGYCRHAVRRHAERLAAMRTGDGSEIVPVADLDAALTAIGAGLRARAEQLATNEPGAGRALEAVAELVDSARGLGPADLEQHLWNLETAMLDRCWEELSEAERAAVDELARAAAASGASEASRERARRAARDRELRRRLGLPRLELPDADPA